MKTKLSIIVPIYNTEKYLPRCIQSLQRQTLREIEIILVDDHSTDGSLKICQKYAAEDERIRIVQNEQGKGVVSAWKSGVKTAKSEFLGFCDSDDYCDADYYEKLYSPIADDAETDMVIGGYVKVNMMTQNVDTYPNLLAPGRYEAPKIKELLKKYFQKDNLLSVSKCTKIVRKKIVTDNFDLYDDRMKKAEDMCASFTWLTDTVKMVVVETVGYNYVQYPVSISHGFHREDLDGFDVICDVFDKITAAKGYEGSYQGELLRQCLKSVLMILISDLPKKEKTECLKYFREKSRVRQVLRCSASELTSFPSKVVKNLYFMKMYRLMLWGAKIWMK